MELVSDVERSEELALEKRVEPFLSIMMPRHQLLCFLCVYRVERSLVREAPWSKERVSGRSIDVLVQGLLAIITRFADNSW